MDDQDDYVYPSISIRIPVWVGGILLAFLFLLFVMGIYFASRGSPHTPQISANQMISTRGFLGTPGAF